MVWYDTALACISQGTKIKQGHLRFLCISVAVNEHNISWNSLVIPVFKLKKELHSESCNYSAVVLACYCKLARLLAGLKLV